MLRRKCWIRFFIVLVFVLAVSCEHSNQANLDGKEKTSRKTYGKGYRYEQEGWIYVHIEGAPFERGKQHGYLVAEEYKKALRCFQAMTYQITGMPDSFFTEEAVRLHEHLIPQEWLEEMRGIAAGLSEAGVRTTLQDIIGWNAWMEIVYSWWPLNEEKYAHDAPKGKERCSSFIATGSATADGKIVLSHSTFDDFWSAQWGNVILDIVPDRGQHLMMQITPGYIASMTDFFVNGAGIFGSETTIGGFNGYDPSGMPEYIRSREAMQYATSIDEFVQLMNKGNNGGVANTWLIGDHKTNEIGQFEQGLIYQNYQKKKDGYFAGSNTVSDPRIRNLECKDTGYNDIRRHTGARRAYWPILLDKYVGKIDVDAAKKMIADHYSMYKKKVFPGAQSICAHFDNDPRYSMSSVASVYPDPFTPGGAVDAKIATSDLAKNMQMWARWGRPCGRPFNAKGFLREHPQWNWQEGYLIDRPSREWITLKGEKTIQYLNPEKDTY